MALSVQKNAPEWADVLDSRTTAFAASRCVLFVTLSEVQDAKVEQLTLDQTRFEKREPVMAPFVINILVQGLACPEPFQFAPGSCLALFRSVVHQGSKIRHWQLVEPARSRGNTS